MVTLNQLCRGRQIRLKKYHRCRTPALRKCPQRKGIVIGVSVVTPKKPNSAKRKIIKVRLSSGRKVRASYPGEYDFKNGLKRFFKILVRGGRIRDVVGVKYKVILGHFDARPFYRRRTSRSKYSVRYSYINVEK